MLDDTKHNHTININKLHKPSETTFFLLHTIAYSCFVLHIAIQWNQYNLLKSSDISQIYFNH